LKLPEISGGLQVKRMNFQFLGDVFSEKLHVKRKSVLQTVSQNKEIVGIFKENPMCIGRESGVTKTFALLIRSQ
jgi:hypothetical protein